MTILEAKKILRHFYGICWECVQIHRGHGMHLPYCLQKMVNRRLAAVSELTEHTIVNEVSVPEYLQKQ